MKRILAKEDMFDNPNDISVLERIVGIVEKERDDYEEYWEKRRKYELLMKKLDSDTPLFQIPAEVLMASFDGTGFRTSWEVVAHASCRKSASNIAIWVLSRKVARLVHPSSSMCKHTSRLKTLSPRLFVGT